MGRNLYAADENALMGQGVRTVAELVQTPELTRAAYAPMKVDAVALGHELQRQLAAWTEARRARDDARSDWEAACEQLAASAARTGGPWLRRLRTHLDLARLEGRLEPLDVPLPGGEIRPARPQRMLARFRALRPLLPRLRALLPGEAAAELLDEGEAIAELLERHASQVIDGETARKRHVREARSLRARVVASLRKLDKLAEGAARAGSHPVPGRSRELLEHHAATRPGRRRPKEEPAPPAHPASWIAAARVGEVETEGVGVETEAAGVET